MAEAGTPAHHVNELTGKAITDGALAQRRALLPVTFFEQIMAAALQAKADPQQHPEAFYQGRRVCTSQFSVTNTPQNKGKCARRAVGADRRLSRRWARW